MKWIGYILGLLMWMFMFQVSSTLPNNDLMFVASVLLVSFCFIQTTFNLLTYPMFKYCENFSEKLFDAIKYLIVNSISIGLYYILSVVVSVYVGVNFANSNYESAFIEFLSSMTELLNVLVPLAMVILIVLLIPWTDLYYGIKKYVKNLKNAEKKERMDK